MSEATATGEVPAPSGPSCLSRVSGCYQGVLKFLGRRMAARATLAVPRTLRFVASMAVTGEVAAAVAAPRLSPAFAAGVAMDEALLAMALTPNRFPRREDYLRVSAEMEEARRLFARRGWLAHPERYHRRPPPVADADVERSRGWAMGLGYERITFDSGFEPRAGEPGRDRWLGYDANRKATATVLRHDDEPRPWVVAVHGFCMGFPFMDFVGLQAAKLHRQLGFNVVLPALPLHGPRKVTRVSGEPFLSFDLMNSVHGLAQSVWDIRRLVSWVRDQGATSVSLYGVSLGAYVASLLCGLEDGIDTVVVGIPVVDLPLLFHEHSPMHIRARSIEHRILGGVAEDVFAVVSPLKVTPTVPRHRRFVYAGYGDRLAFPDQARALWEHWEKPAISWYAGNHVGYLWSRQVMRFLDEALRPGEGARAGASPRSDGAEGLGPPAGTDHRALAGSGSTSGT